MPVEHHPVVGSSHVAHMSYDSDREELTVQYRGERSVTFRKVDDSLWGILKAAPSKGSALHQFVYPFYARKPDDNS